MAQSLDVLSVVSGGWATWLSSGWSRWPLYLLCNTPVMASSRAASYCSPQQTRSRKKHWNHCVYSSMRVWSMSSEIELLTSSYGTAHVFLRGWSVVVSIAVITVVRGLRRCVFLADCRWLSFTCRQCPVLKRCGSLQTRHELASDGHAGGTSLGAFTIT